VVRALSATAAIAALITCGTTIGYGRLSVPGPFAALAKLPFFNALTPARFGLAVLCLSAVLLGLAADRWATATQDLVHQGASGLSIGATSIRRIGYAVLCAVLVPLIPTPISVEQMTAVPKFFTAGAWRNYVRPGDSVVGVPLPALSRPDAMRWGSATNTEVPLARGYMLGPIGADGTHVAYSPPERTLGRLLDRAALNGIVPATISASKRAAVALDVRYWHAAIIVVSAEQVRVNAVIAVGTELFGPPTLVGGAWIWDVSGLRQPP
jgi:hypothetical protein